MVIDLSNFTVCGHDCSYCPAFRGTADNKCPGCNEAKEGPWWGSCKLYNCVEKHEVEHCGLCDEFPCDLQVGHFDPDNPNGQQNAVIRSGILAYRAKHGEEKALDLLRQVKGPP